MFEKIVASVLILCGIGELILAFIASLPHKELPYPQATFGVALLIAGMIASGRKD